MGSLLTKSLSQDERDALLHQLAHLNKAESHLVDTIINVNPSNDDNLLLILGALARNNDAAIQNKVVKELIRRLNVAKSTGNSSEVVVFINYALGNTGSRLTIDALLSSLIHDDIDTQISVIRGLDVHLDQPAVQQALITLLTLSTEDAILEEVLLLLKDAFNNKVLRSPSKELLNATVDMTIRLENANLYELLIQYLMLIGTSEAKEIINIVMHQHNYGDVIHEHVNNVTGDLRIKRGSDWDSTSNSVYDLVASSFQRRYDVITYPIHKAYLWGDKYGVSKLNLKVGVGAFAGAYCGGHAIRLKIFAKGITELYVLGKTYKIAHLEYSDYTSGDKLVHKVYVKLGRSVHKNVYEKYDLSCKNSRTTLWDTSATIFNFRIPFFVYVATIHFFIRGTVSTTGTAGVCMCPLELKACANIKPSVHLRVTGGAEASLLVS